MNAPRYDSIKVDKNRNVRKLFKLLQTCLGIGALRYNLLFDYIIVPERNCIIF
jgi:hypothetical protein